MTSPALGQGLACIGINVIPLWGKEIGRASREHALYDLEPSCFRDLRGTIGPIKKRELG